MSLLLCNLSLIVRNVVPIIVVTLLVSACSNNGTQSESNSGENDSSSVGDEKSDNEDDSQNEDGSQDPSEDEATSGESNDEADTGQDDTDDTDDTGQDDSTETGDGAPLGTICENDSECESGKCYIIYWWNPEPFGTCSLCNSDNDCSEGKNGAGTCGFKDPLDPMENFTSCQDGSIGHICQPDSTGCVEDLMCAHVFADSPMACSECQSDTDCGENRLCDASRPGNNGTNRFWLECIDRNSRENGTPCPKNDAGEGRDEFCKSEHCAEVSLGSDLPEDLKIHLCGECKEDSDCEEGQTCKQGILDAGMLTHSTCVDARLQ